MLPAAQDVQLESPRLLPLPSSADAVDAAEALALALGLRLEAVADASGAEVVSIDTIVAEAASWRVLAAECLREMRAFFDGAVVAGCELALSHMDDRDFAVTLLSVIEDSRGSVGSVAGLHRTGDPLRQLRQRQSGD